jgi:hypothetical protein
VSFDEEEDDDDDDDDDDISSTCKVNIIVFGWLSESTTY